MQEIIFIDGGSLLTPEGITREWVKKRLETAYSVFPIMLNSYRSTK